MYSKLASELKDVDLLPSSWDWFVSEGGGLEECLICYRRFGPDIKAPIVNVIIQFAQSHFLELFSLQLRTVLSQSKLYLQTMNDFLPVLCSIRAAKQELVS